MANKKTAGKKRNLALPVAAALVLVVAVALLLKPAQPAGSSASETGDLLIPLSEITETASFYPITIDGTAMEVLAIRTASGEIRTAFNTCQSCYTSGSGYYIPDGPELVCQNCGFRFTAEAVGLEGHGGCNPWPILPTQRTEDAESIRIPHDVLADAKSIFANWTK